IVLGDLFDRPNVAPVFRELVRKDVIEPLGKAGIEVWLLAGNHDQPRADARSTSLEDYRGYPHVRVFRSPEAVEKEVAGHRVGFLMLPYLHPEQVLENAKGKGIEEVEFSTIEDAYIVARSAWKGWIAQHAESMKDSTFRLVLGHYYVEGARVSSTTNIEVIPGEFSFTRDMIPPSVDLAVMGYIHLHQRIWGNVVYTGAPERIDWGERGDRKGFLALSPETKAWEFVELPARAMEKVEVTVHEGDDPTAAILAGLPPTVKDAMVRLEVTIPDALRIRVDDRKIAERLQDAFHYEVRWIAVERDTVAPSEYTLDPLRLLGDFVDRTFEKDPRRDAIRMEGEKILREVLG
ncbi:MAG TPA: metallophosphoesterase, partial [Thermoplasmata archaeon]|nr:metallophosphoesterase [Thermoplasmata archaeon]